MLALKGMKISTCLNLAVAGCLLLTALLIVVVVNRSERQQALREAEQKARLLLDRNLALHHFFSAELKPTLLKSTEQIRGRDYFEPVWMSSTFAVRRIDHYFKGLNRDDYYYKECAVNARSPENEADGYERDFIRQLNGNPGLVAQSVVREINGRPYFVVLLRGETMEKGCLRCHGTPEEAPADMVGLYGRERSFHRRVGETVSAISIRIPLAAAYAEANRLTWQLSALLVMLLLFLFAAQVWINRLLVAIPMARLQWNEGALRLSEAKLVRAQQIARLGSWEWDVPDDRICWSRELYSILNIRPDQFGGNCRAFLDLVHPDDRQAVADAVESALGTGSPNRLEHRIVLPDGAVRHILELADVTFDASGRVVRLEGTAQDITELKRAEEALLVYQQQLKSLAEELCRAEERERRRIATDLHDQIGQTLAFAKIRLGALSGLGGAAEQARTLAEIGEALDRAIQEVRSLTFQLSPPVLYEVGLEAALESLAERFQQEHGFRVEFRDDGLPKPVAGEVAITLFQVVREVMVNIVKHARAKTVKIALAAADTSIKITIEDDGAGFDVTSVLQQRGSQRGFGLFNIQQRMAHLGGGLAIRAEIGRGTTVFLQAPLLID